MLLPKKRIFVVYGHNEELLKDTINAVKEAESSGYRVKLEIVDENSLKKRRDVSIFVSLCEKLDVVDAAIVLATADDIGIAKKDIGKENLIDIDKLKPRVRQNVLLELGMLLNKVGGKNILSGYRV